MYTEIRVISPAWIYFSCSVIVFIATFLDYAAIYLIYFIRSYYIFKHTDFRTNSTSVTLFEVKPSKFNSLTNDANSKSRKYRENIVSLPTRVTKYALHVLTICFSFAHVPILDSFQCFL